MISSLQPNAESDIADKTLNSLNQLHCTSISPRTFRFSTDFPTMTSSLKIRQLHTNLVFNYRLPWVILWEISTHLL